MEIYSANELNIAVIFEWLIIRKLSQIKKKIHTTICSEKKLKLIKFGLNEVSRN